ncbi:fructose-bisphosphate aldolase [Pavlovales sp. CCMP2436]|nr:fructose-bisphosphate aldolase [Pavlovales sp. CCMP2436]
MRVTPSGSNGAFLSTAQKADLAEIAALVARPGKGLSACDEGPATVGARFEAVGVANSEETRRAYRQMLFETPGAELYLSGAILDPETLYQRSSNSNELFPKVLSDRGIVPGVKPHLKVYALPGCGGETVMQGLDSLSARCKEYRQAGARFAKWRSPLEIREGQISRLALESNMHDLARYALICQAEGLMPIVEPDISLVGDYDLETAVRVNVEVQAELYKAMIDHGVYMEGATLKPNMINPGKGCTTKYTCAQIAQANIDVLSRVFPCAMKGANFLSGGQSLENAAARLSAINKVNGLKLYTNNA